MPKHEAGTPKAIANRMKSKGLQKLKWYCEMCQKQCRDENGFKCHTTSEGHLRQMRIFSENPHKMVDQFSDEFEEAFIETLSRLHGTKRVRANQVYQEVIADKQHVHMNATKWDTLTTFVKYLGKQGHCLVDETEKGWFVQYIDRAYLKRKEELDKQKKADLEEDVRMQRLLAARSEAAKKMLEESGRLTDQPASTELVRENDDSKIVIATSLSKPGGSSSGAAAGGGGGGVFKRPPTSVFGGADDDAKAGSKKAKTASGGGGGGKKSELDKLIEADNARKKAEEEQLQKKKREAAEERTENWLARGIIVKVLNKKVAGGRFYKKKARIDNVIDDFVGELRMLEDGDRLRVDQDELETVIPAVDGNVLILNGPGKGALARLLELDTDNFCAKIKVEEGPRRGEVLTGVQYEDISKADVDFLGR